jgi:ribosomal protein S18 acetylase RimI-like enzyme
MSGGGTGISFRAYREEDYQGISAVLYATGFLGEDLAGTGLFNDRRLFALVNTDGYLRFLPSSCFVAVDESDGKVAGYILGAVDSRDWERIFTRRMYWRIAVRAFLVSFWKYPESFRHVLGWARGYTDASVPFFPDYPAHLHINVMPGFQRRGIGDGLMRLFEERIIAQGATGVHLVTSNRNVKALPFYARHGYAVLVEKPGTYYRGIEDHRSIVFGKRFAPQPPRS